MKKFPNDFYYFGHGTHLTDKEIDQHVQAVKKMLKSRNAMIQKISARYLFQPATRWSSAIATMIVNGSMSAATTTSWDMLLRSESL